jgi:HK97 family phage prohead protease
MTDRSAFRTFALAPVPDLAPTTDTADRTLSGLVVPYGQVTTRAGAGVVFTRGCLTLPDRLSDVKLLVQHDDDRPVGYATAATDTDAGLEMTFALAEHPRSDALLAEAEALLRDGFSVGVELADDTLDALTTAFWSDRADLPPVVLAGALREVSAVSVPQFNDARQSHAAPALATFTTPREDTPPMPPSTDLAPPLVETAAAPPIRPADLPTLAELAAAVSDLIGEQSTPSTHPLAAFASLTTYADAAFTNPALRFALVDQTTVDNAVLVQPGWLTEIAGLIEQARPAIAALSGGSMPASGMEIDWPYYDGDLASIVAVQAAEKTEIHSVKVSFKKGSAPVETFAGGSDVSYQLIRRSSPSYREAYLRILASAYGLTTEASFTADLYAAAGQNVVFNTATGTSLELRAALFQASSLVKKATGRPATTVLAATDVYTRLGGLTELWPTPYGTTNVSGTATASTLVINVSGLEITEAPTLANGQVVVTNSSAVSWLGDGPFVVTAEDVAKLGQNIAIWGMGSTVAQLPQGIVTLDDGLPLGTRSGGSAAKKS